MKKYVIYQPVIGGAYSDSLDEKIFHTIKNSMICINTCSEIARKMQIVFENYKAFEFQNFSIALEHSMRTVSDNILFQDLFSKINMSVMNFLASVRMYHDHRNVSVSRLHKMDMINTDSIKMIFCHRYDNSIEYRLGEAIRNYTQHHNLPVSSLTLGMRKSATDIFERGNEYSFDPKILFQPLIDSKKIKNSIKEELKSINMKGIDVKYFIRSYFEELCGAHSSVLDATKDIFDESCNMIRNDSRKFVTGIDSQFLSLGEKIGDSITEIISISEQVVENAEHNRKITRLGSIKRHAHCSNEIIWQKDYLPNKITHPSSTLK